MVTKQEISKMVVSLVGGGLPLLVLGAGRSTCATQHLKLVV